MHHTGINPSDPTPEEIAAAISEIQNGWSKAERRRRKAGYVPEDQLQAGWFPPTYSGLLDMPSEAEE